MTPPWCENFKNEMAALEEGLQEVVTILRKLNVKLKTLKISYAGMWNAKVERLLSEPFVAAPGYEDNYERAHVATPVGAQVIVRTPNGKEYFECSLMGLYPIKHFDIFGLLRQLNGQVEYCKLRGDRPTKYLDYMRAKMDEGTNPSVPIKALRNREEKAEAKRVLWKEQMILEDHVMEKARAEAAMEEV